MTAEHLSERYQSVRAATEALCAPLSPEDQTLQSMPDASPTKWHRAHTSWFFETFVLGPRGVPAFDPAFGFLFNSYYESLGPRHSRPRRGLLSRPSAREVSAYRRAVDERMGELLRQADAPTLAEIAPLVELGIAHEEQHQELILTDILHAFSYHPLRPRYRTREAPNVAENASIRRLPCVSQTTPRYHAYPGGLVTIGAPRDGSFRFDNEEPVHRVWLEPFEFAERLVTVGEWKAFAREGGYVRPSLWLSDGLDWVKSQTVRAPLYLEHEHDSVRVFGLDGTRTPSDDEPLVHVSYYEADAIARFLGGRLPREEEWELVARENRVEGNFVESGTLCALAPRSRGAERGPMQLFGDAWEWTSSSYAPYPGYTPKAGALGEYNGKFMINQAVLRGGSCFTPHRHMRASYRNFWPPHTRFQVTGIRLARSLSGR